MRRSTGKEILAPYMPREELETHEMERTRNAIVESLGRLLRIMSDTVQVSSYRPPDKLKKLPLGLVEEKGELDMQERTLAVEVLPHNFGFSLSSNNFDLFNVLEQEKIKEAIPDWYEFYPSVSTKRKWIFAKRGLMKKSVERELGKILK